MRCGRIEFYDAIQAVERDDDAVSNGQGAAGQAGAAAAGDKGHVVLMTQTHRLDHLVLVDGQDDSTRPRAEGGQRVRFVGGQLRRLKQQTRRRIEPGEVIKEWRIGHGSAPLLIRSTHQMHSKGINEDVDEVVGIVARMFDQRQSLGSSK